MQILKLLVYVLMIIVLYRLARRYLKPVVLVTEGYSECYVPSKKRIF